MSLTTIDTSCKQSCAASVLLWLAYFIYHNVLKFLLGCSIWQDVAFPQMFSGSRFYACLVFESPYLPVCSFSLLPPVSSCCGKATAFQYSPLSIWGFPILSTFTKHLWASSWFFGQNTHTHNSSLDGVGREPPLLTSCHNRIQKGLKCPDA